MKFLIIQLGRIGDMILLTPMFRAIKEFYPDSHIDILASRHNKIILQNNTRINHIYTWEKSPLKLLKLIMDLRGIKYDYLIDPKDHYSTESAIIARIAKAGNKIGYNRPGKKIFDIPIESDVNNTGKHFTERAILSLSSLGINHKEFKLKPELFINPESEEFVTNFIRKYCTKPLLTLNISAGNSSRMWQINKWALLIKSIDLSKYTIVLSSAPKDIHLANELKSSCPDLQLFHSRSFEDVISLIKNSLLLITPDTSLVHVASAFDVPLFGLFCSDEENYNKFKPLCNKYFAIRPIKGESNIAGIDTDRVIPEFHNFIDKSVY
ncbi:MAG: family 9 glycosyl transferase [Ignavibacteria bacterium]|nr:family 9 glycosyl transferase [Ignavibacteria bacterium]